MIKINREGDPVSEIDPMEILNPQSNRECFFRDFLPQEKYPFRSLLTEKYIKISSDFKEKIYLKNTEYYKNPNNSFITNELSLNNKINVEERIESLDSFISSVMRNNHEPIILRNSTAMHIPQPSTASETLEKGFFSSEGFFAAMYSSLLFNDNDTVNGVRIFDDTNSSQYVRVDFTPNGRSRLDRKKMTESLALGISGLIKYFQAIDRGEVQTAALLIGTTNLPMALICQRIGFSIVDQCKTEDGQINKNLSLFTVVGKVEDIRRKVVEFQKAGIAEKLCEREKRLQVRSVVPRLSTSFA